MITNSIILFNTRNLLILFFGIIIHFEAIAQNHSKEFEIEITNTKSGFELRSNQGSRWLNLSFSNTKFKTENIDEEGMVGSRVDTVPTDNEYADYLITFSKKNDIVTLIGVKGTSWKELSFKLPLNQTQKINQDGIMK